MNLLNVKFERLDRRTNFRIEMEILRACIQPKTVTYVMYATRINATTIQRVSKTLQCREFLKIIEAPTKTRRPIENGRYLPRHALGLAPITRVRRFYATTEKGKQVLDAFDKFIEIYGAEVK